MNLSRYVNLAFVTAGLLMWIVSAEAFAAAIDWFAPTWNRPLLGADFVVSDLLGLTAGLATAITLWRHKNVRTAALDIASELSRVTWPGWEETRNSTFVVMVVTLVVSLILGFFDYVWAWLTSQIYGI
jgi:preprotein translocase SecE subunit